MHRLSHNPVELYYHSRLFFCSNLPFNMGIISLDFDLPIQTVSSRSSGNGETLTGIYFEH